MQSRQKEALPTSGCLRDVHLPHRLPMLFDREQLPCIGVVTKPHGIKGVLCVRGLALFSLALEASSQVMVHSTQALREDSVLVHKQVGTLWHVQLQGVTSRTQAQALAQAQLLAHPTALQALNQHTDPTSLAQHFQTQALWDAVLGCRVVDEASQPLGVVEGVFSTGANDVLEVRPDAGGDMLLIPWVEHVLLGIDLAQRTLRVRLLESV